VGYARDSLPIPLMLPVVGQTVTPSVTGRDRLGGAWLEIGSGRLRVAHLDHSDTGKL
jgi:hypothetical protein